MPLMIQLAESNYETSYSLLIWSLLLPKMEMWGGVKYIFPIIV